MEQLSTSWLILILVCMVIISAYFSGTETSMMAINRYRLRHLVRKNNRSAKRVQQFLERTDRLLGVILIGNTFANVLAATLATLITLRLYGNAGVAITTFLLTLILLIFAEITPKTIAALYPQNFAFLAVWPLGVILKILYPFVWVANGITSGILRLLGIKIKKTNHDEHLTGDELRTVLFESGGLIPRSHKEILLRVLDLEKVTVSDIMVPRSEIMGIDLDDDWETILRIILDYPHTHLPVYSENIDQIQGLLHTRKALNLFALHKLTKETLISVIEDCYYVPDSTPLSTQLLNFQTQRRRIGMVVDEYGDIEGLVTLEDILEEIVGEFAMNFGEIYREVEPQKDGSYLVDGSVYIRELNRMMNWHFSVEGPNTLSGQLIEYLEMIPEVGTCVLLSNYPIEVVEMKGNLVKVVRIFKRLKKKSKFEENRDGG